MSGLVGGLCWLGDEVDWRWYGQGGVVDGCVGWFVVGGDDEVDVDGTSWAKEMRTQCVG